jgi:hypothetical protein
MTYHDFTQPFPRAFTDRAVAHGGTAILTWEPMVAGAGPIQPAYTLASIYNGVHDAYLQSWIDAIWGTSYSDKFIIRFAHEMNGTWYPWSEAVNGNATGDYKRAFDYVVDKFNSAGLWQKVLWQWCPNIPFNGSIPLPGLFPSAGRANLVGLDGFNFGTTDQYSRWKSPQELLNPGLAALRAVASGTSIIISEISCAPSENRTDQTKEGWITEMVRFLEKDQGDVIGFAWFNERKFDEVSLGQTEPTDWRLDATDASIRAMKNALVRVRTGTG